METKTHYRITTDDLVLQSYLARMSDFTRGPWAYLPINKVDVMFGGQGNFTSFCQLVITKGARPARRLSISKVMPSLPKNPIEYAALLFSQPAQPWTPRDKSRLDSLTKFNNYCYVGGIKTRGV